jgi:hypothetical protein
VAPSHPSFVAGSDTARASCEIIALIDDPAVFRRIPVPLGLWSARRVTELGTKPLEAQVDDGWLGKTECGDE